MAGRAQPGHPVAPKRSAKKSARKGRVASVSGWQRSVPPQDGKVIGGREDIRERLANITGSGTRSGRHPGNRRRATSATGSICASAGKGREREKAKDDTRERADDRPRDRDRDEG